MQNIQEKNNPFLIMLFPLIFTLIPSPSSSGLQSLIFPAIGAILLFIGLKWYLNANLNQGILYVLAMLFIYALTIALSITFSSNIKAGDFFQIAKPFYFGIILLFGFFVARLNDEKSIIKGLLTVAYLMIFAQLVTGITQLLDIPLFDFIYSDEKSRPFGRMMRLVGTTGNPNTFGWLVIQSAVIITLFETRSLRKWLWIAIVTMLLVFSGSRSMLIMLPIIIIGASLIATRKNIKFYIFKVPIYICLLALSYFSLIWFLEKYQTSFPYLSQLLTVLNGEGIDSINSVELRTVAWDSALLNFSQNSGLSTWLFGLGAGTYPVMDNTYYYSIINTGYVGLATVLALFLMLIFIFKKVKNIKIKALGYQYIIFSLALGIQADTISGWTYPAFALFYAGIAIAIVEKQKNTSAQGEVYVPHVKEKVKRQRKRYRIVWSK